MQTVKIWCALALACLCMLPACSQKNKNAHEPPESWKTLARENYTIHYPDSLEVDESGKLGVRFFLYFPQESPKDRFRENINLTLEDLQGYDMSLEQYAEASKQQILNYMPKAKILESSTETDGTGNKYHRLIFEGAQGVASGTDGTYTPRFDLTFVQHYRVVDGKAYVLTLTTERHRFADYQKTGEQIMHTFQVE